MSTALMPAVSFLARGAGQARRLTAFHLRQCFGWCQTNGLDLGTNALRASGAAAVRTEDYTYILRGHRVLHMVGKGNKGATLPLTVRLRILEACRGE